MTPTPTDVPFVDDELPAPPSGPQAAQSAEPISGAIDGALLGDVPKLGEALPIGTYHFRLDRYSESWAEPDKSASPEELLFGKQPQFLLFWSCQEEPHTGQPFVDFVEWVSPDVLKMAAERNQSALKLLRTRLARAKAILQAAEYPIVGQLDYKTFLSSHPEIKIQLGLREGKQKTSSGELVPTGEMRNRPIRYISLRRPT